MTAARKNPPLPEYILGYARRLRVDQTDAESKLWYFLRDRRFDGLKFRRQQAIDGVIVDFYCSAVRLVIEVDGSQHGGSKRKKRDAERDAELAAKGIRVLRFWDNEALTNTRAVLEEIWRATPHAAHCGEKD
jgi:very-short-patch-repair endonuclease